MWHPCLAASVLKARQLANKIVHPKQVDLRSEKSWQICTFFDKCTVDLNFFP